MNDNGSISEVSAALVKCQGELKAAEFDATNPFFKRKYATLGAVIAASREALAKNGLAMLQVPSIDGDKVSVHTRIVHSSGQSLDGGTMSLPLEGNDRNSDAQVAGSILTYLKRYAWASVLGIYADHDDDGNSDPQRAPGAVARPKTTMQGQQGNQNASQAVLSTPKGTLATEKTRMWALNQLMGAPGQSNRNGVQDYLRAQGWIGVEQECESWDLGHVPTNKTQLAELAAAIAEFEHESRGPDDDDFPGDPVTGRTDFL